MRKFLILQFFFWALMVCVGQRLPADSGTFTWGSAGVCLGYSGNFRGLPGLRAGVDLSMHQKYFFSLQGSTANNFDGFGTKLHPNTIVEQQNISALAGYGRYLTRHIALTGLAGLSFGQGNYRGRYLGMKETPGIFGGTVFEPEYDYSEYHYVGIPLHLRAMIAARFIGLSMEVYYNLKKYPDYGLALSLLIGRIHSR